MRFVLDNGFNFSKQLYIKRVRFSEIKKLLLCYAPVVLHIHSPSQRSNLLRQVHAPQRKLVPLKSGAGDRKDIALLLCSQENDKRFVGGQRLLHLSDREWKWVREGRVTWKFPREPEPQFTYTQIDVGQLRFGSLKIVCR